MINSGGGFYEVAGHRYLNKFKAFEASFPHGWWPHWNFHDEFFSQQDWTREPIEDIKSLYRQRALDLRQQFDYLILWYSGGSDSHTVAKSFVDNGIRLDELWHRTGLDRHRRLDRGQDVANQANETRFTTLPQVKELMVKDPNLKFTMFDAMNYSLQYWHANKINIDESNYFNPLLPAKSHSDLFNTHKNYQKIGKITALDKPRVYYENSSWWFSFIDMPIHTQIMMNRPNDSDERDVCFFWDPGAIKILIKQSHMIRSWFESHPSMMHLARRDLSPQEKIQWEHIIKSIIYPDWDLTTWQVGKPSNDIEHPEFFWFYQDQNSQAYQNWKDTARTFSEEINLIKQKSTDVEMQQSIKNVDGWWMLPGCRSKAYRIGS
jgi:hypothetical protein